MGAEQGGQFEPAILNFMAIGDYPHTTRSSKHLEHSCTQLAEAAAAQEEMGC